MICLISVLITIVWLIYRNVTGILLVTYYEIIIYILILQPALWWVGKQYDKSTYHSKTQLLQQKELESLFNNNYSFLWVIDEMDKKLVVSRGIEEIAGYTSKEFEGNFELWMSRTYPEDQEKVHNHYRRLLAGSPSKCEWRFFRKDGEIRWLEVFGNPIFSESGTLIKLNGVAYDITERKQLEEKLEKMAYYDSLTGLPNRRFFKESSQKAISRCVQYNQNLAVMFIDLDRFKFINDTMGHDIGDKLLKKVSKRISRCIRDTDIVARHGGDEFIILLDDIEKPEVSKIAARILNEFSTPFELEEGELFTTPSIGISLYPRDGENIAALTKKADNAMYLAKKRGKNNFQFYVYENEDIMERRLKIEQGLKAALDNSEFELHYQPKIVLTSGEICGVEALLRWRHPELGVISPLEFIPVAEETGFIRKIGEWVIKEACRQNKLWQKSGLYIKVAVNVSSIQFEDDLFAERIRQALMESQLSPEYLGVEITESVMQNVELTSVTLHELKQLGVKVSVDDFGTGYSSLSVLSKMPIDLVKIDKSFIDEMLTDSNTASLVKTMITMAEDLELDIIAEGIENEQQVTFLIENGCQFGQGYLYSPPIPSAETEKILKQQLMPV
ncbi:putative bifunctional diguanylate cyclase/phosphodiesterase [Alkalicoccus halolimnae]|uniref:EAL domain-containing protein n=1 Tax=Alkalicoccus halolimnae TaxID=1667239 RepID=A0AAJ8LVS3_9BACI|nr:EAL domain-containing protein [Alkalicoccus halolimnae]